MVHCAFYWFSCFSCQKTIFLLRPSLLQSICPCWLTPALLVAMFAVAEGPASTAFIQALQDQLMKFFEQHDAGLWLYRMCFQNMSKYAMLMLQSAHESNFLTCGQNLCHEHLICTQSLQQACTWPWPCMHMTMEQCQLSNHPCHHVTSKHDPIPSNILKWWNKTNHVDSWCGNSFLSMHEHDLQTTLPTSQHTLACVPCSMATKFCWSESFLAPFLFFLQAISFGACALYT